MKEGIVVDGWNGAVTTKSYEGVDLLLGLTLLLAGQPHLVLVLGSTWYCNSLVLSSSIRIEVEVMGRKSDSL